MFVRVKTINKKEYGYLVENRWKKGKVKQKVKGYLGPVVKLEKIQDTPFATWKKVDLFTYIHETSMKTIMEDLFSWTLAQHENKELEITKSSVKRKGKDVVLELHDGYWHKKAMRALRYFQPTPEDRPGETLAAAFKNAAIPVEKDVFILLYKKIYAL